MDKKQYEFKDHLGNVRATIGDYKMPFNDATSTRGVAPFFVDEKATNDYYPYGMLISDRSFNSGSSRYGYNGKENDNEVKGIGNQQVFSARIYDNRTIRFYSLDPYFQTFVFNSPYLYAGNSPISAIDENGGYIYIKTGNQSVIVALQIVDQTQIGKMVLDKYRNNPNKHLFLGSKDLSMNKHSGETLNSKNVQLCIENNLFNIKNNVFGNYTQSTKESMSNFEGLNLDNSKSNFLINFNDAVENTLSLFGLYTSESFSSSLDNTSLKQIKSNARSVFHEIAIHVFFAELSNFVDNSDVQHLKAGENYLFGIIEFDTGIIKDFNSQLNNLGDTKINETINEQKNTECFNESEYK